jgi:hypothetical protein
VPVRQIGKSEISESKTHEMFNAVTKSFKHAANLPINSLVQHNAQTRGRNVVKSRDLCSVAVEKNSAQQFWREGWVPRVIQRHFIFFVDFESRVSKSLRELAIVRKQKQTFSLSIETTDVKKAGKFPWKQIEDCISRVRIFPGRNEPGGFVQHDRESWSGTNKFGVDFDVVVRARLSAEVCADFTVDSDATLGDQLIRMSPRTNAGSGEEAIQAHQRISIVEALNR